MRKPNWKIINKVRREKKEAQRKLQEREVSPGV